MTAKQQQVFKFSFQISPFIDSFEQLIDALSGY